MKTIKFKRVCIFIGLVFLGVQLFAQNTFEIRGKIIKSDRPEQNHASVTLLDSKSMEIVAEETCNADGVFVIEGVTKGNYILLVQKLGFSKPERRFISIDYNGTVVQTADIGTNSENSVSKKTL